MSQIILYDLPSKPPCKCWSFNPWKPRLVLNYKGIDYKTEWIEYPDLVPTLKSYGLTPNDPNEKGYFTDYTSPAIRFADGTCTMDSWKIVHALEKSYPEPSMHLDDPILKEVMAIFPECLGPLRGVAIPKVPRNLLNKSSAEYFELTREEQFGKPLTLVESEDGGEEAWSNVKSGAEKMAALLKKNGGPFFLGKTVSYADFILVSLLHFYRRIDQSIFDRFVAHDAAFSKIYEASAPWLKKDD